MQVSHFFKLFGFGPAPEKYLREDHPSKYASGKVIHIHLPDVGASGAKVKGRRLGNPLPFAPGLIFGSVGNELFSEPAHRGVIGNSFDNIDDTGLQRPFFVRRCVGQARYGEV